MFLWVPIELLNICLFVWTSQIIFKTEEASCFNARELLEYSRTPIQAIKWPPPFKRPHSISPRVAVRVRLVRRTLVKFQITVCKNPKFMSYKKVTYLSA